MDNKDNINVLKQDDFKLEIYHGKELIVEVNNACIRRYY